MRKFLKVNGIKRKQEDTEIMGMMEREKLRVEEMSGGDIPV